MAESYLKVTESNGVTVVHLPAELMTVGIVASFRDAWDEVLEGKPTKILVDFDEVRRFGSEATGILIRVAQRVEEWNGAVKLCSMSDTVKEIFTICRLIPSLFEVYPSAGAALDAFGH